MSFILRLTPRSMRGVSLVLHSWKLSNQVRWAMVAMSAGSHEPSDSVRPMRWHASSTIGVARPERSVKAHAVREKLCSTDDVTARE